MKSNILKYLACGAMALGLAATVQATQISGSIGFAGTYTANGMIGNDLSTATTMTINSFSVLTASGDLTPAGAPMSFFSPIGVNSNPPTIGQLWSVTVVGKVFNFTVLTETQNLTSPNAIHLLGTGTLTEVGGPLTATGGNWQLGFGADGASFTFQSTTGSIGSIPDGGMTVMLLGAALSGLALIRRKLA